MGRFSTWDPNWANPLRETSELFPHGTEDLAELKIAVYEFDPLGNILQPPGWVRSWMEEILPRLAPVASMLSLQSLAVVSTVVQVPQY